MDGKTLRERVRKLLNETSTSSFLDTRLTYDALYEAALALVSETECLKTSQSITTVADQAAYVLNADFINLYLRDDENKRYVIYNDGSVNQFLTEISYEELVKNDNASNSQDYPSNFALLDYSTQYSNMTGTATSNGAATGGKCSLIDTSGDFTNASAGDTVHNTTDGSTGVVISKTSTTRLEIALFGGTNNDVSTSDAYVIVPQGRMKIILDPPPATASHTVTVHYVQMPIPVYTDYDAYRFSRTHLEAMIKYAAWLYKYRDGEPEFGNAYYQQWVNFLRTAKNQVSKTLNQVSFKVNRKKRR